MKFCCCSSKDKENLEQLEVVWIEHPCDGVGSTQI